MMVGLKMRNMHAGDAAKSGGLTELILECIGQMQQMFYEEKP